MNDTVNGQLRFTLGQVIQLLTLLVAFILGYASLKSEVRESRAMTDYRLTLVEQRLSKIETRTHR